MGKNDQARYEAASELIKAQDNVRAQQDAGTLTESDFARVSDAVRTYDKRSGK